MTDREFSPHDITRRDFVRLSAATGGALALPGGATASVDSAKFDAEYQYVLNHTPQGHTVPTLVTFADAAGFDALEAVAAGEVRTTTTPRPAAYTSLTTAQAQQAVEIPTAEEFTHSPGANPFWRLGYYPLGVFPEATRSADFIDFDENVAGLRHLASEHPDRLNLYGAGRSPGHYNYLSDREDPRPVWFAELTNDVGDREAFAEKEKLVFVLSIHGDERAGVEAGSRFVENLLRGQEPAIAALLDELALVFVYANPDGWAARRPQYESYGVPGGTLHERGNGSGVDTNRQYPNMGWINTGFYPGESYGRDLEEDVADGIDRDVPSGIAETVPDALWIVETLREYDNVGYVADLHGMLTGGGNFVYGLVNQDQFDHGKAHDMHRWNRLVDEAVTANVDEWREAAAAQETVVGENFGVLPEETYDWGTIWDTLSYTVPGGLIDWASAPEEFGGLDATAIAYEMAYSNIVGGNAFDPQRVDMQVRGYRAAIRKTAEHAGSDLGTQVVTGDTTTGYVPSDALSVDAEDLEFVEDGEYVGDDGDGFAATWSSVLTVAAGETATETVTVEDDADALVVGTQPRGDLLVAAELRDPSGDAVRRYDPRDVRAYDGMPTWHVSDPATGDWTLAVAQLEGTHEAVDVSVGRYAMDAEAPDPGHVERWGGGFEQRDYGTADAQQYFRDYDEYVADDGSIEAVDDPDAFAELDSLVVVHDDVTDAQVAAIDEFVADGGTLVLTDSGVSLLAELDNAATAAFDADSVRRQELFVANVNDRNEDHPLLTDTRSIQRQLYNAVAQGIETGSCPMWLVDPDDFGAAGGTVAGTTDGDVAAGTIARTDVDGTVHVVGGLLQPPNQDVLHPFGLLDYSVTFFGHTVLGNALGHVQLRTVDGEVTRTFGPAQFAPNEPPTDGVTASGSRDAGDPVQVGGDTVRVSVELSHDADEALPVRDRIPYSYEVIETGETVEDVEKRRDDQVQLLTIGPDAPADETLQFEYLVRTAESVGTQRRSGRYDLGPAELYDPEADEWVDVAGTTETHVVIAAEPLQDA